jgi:hypothetical protein
MHSNEQTRETMDPKSRSNNFLRYDTGAATTWMCIVGGWNTALSRVNGTY